VPLLDVVSQGFESASMLLAAHRIRAGRPGVVACRLPLYPAPCMRLGHPALRPIRPDQTKTRPTPLPPTLARSIFGSVRSLSLSAIHTGATDLVRRDAERGAHQTVAPHLVEVPFCGRPICAELVAHLRTAPAKDIGHLHQPLSELLLVPIADVEMACVGDWEATLKRRAKGSGPGRVRVRSGFGLCAGEHRGRASS
jgi:hypothetical protein